MSKIYILKQVIENEEYLVGDSDEESYDRRYAPQSIVTIKYFSSQVAFDDAVKRASEYGIMDKRPQIETSHVEIDFNQGGLRLLPIVAFVRNLNQNIGNARTIPEAKRHIHSLVNTIQRNHAAILERRQAFLFGTHDRIGADSPVKHSFKDNPLFDSHLIDEILKFVSLKK